MFIDPTIQSDDDDKNDADNDGKVHDNNTNDGIPDGDMTYILRELGPLFFHDFNPLEADPEKIESYFRHTVDMKGEEDAFHRKTK